MTYKAHIAPFFLSMLSSIPRKKTPGRYHLMLSRGLCEGIRKGKRKGYARA